ncbi:MAG: UDP-glucose/GDP-mannose dehydrogenase family protein [Candidatus Aenigmarchaeota archaeon]|nr:UDP-glucose/GDP-mannose dehydrogenase family protein [Candidatus Aenigmarchaeota archaeon]
MNLSVIGCGYVGLVTAVGFSSRGHDVICVDVDEKKVDMINSGEPPIYESDLEPLIKSCIQEKKIHATKNFEDAVKNTQITFICVGTPSKGDGGMESKYVFSVADSLGKFIGKKAEYHLVVFKSTIVPGTTASMISIIEKSSGKKAGKDFGVCMSPEFLKEGNALDDFFNPDRIVIGEFDKVSGDVLENLFIGFNAPILRTSIKVAETIKYASNSFLAMKVSFSNEVGNICKLMGIDVYEVMTGLGMDERISPEFLRAGCGFGGSCFGKDVLAFIDTSKKIGYVPYLLESVMELNEAQPSRMIELLKKHTALMGAKVCVLGLAFKPGTDDIRDAPSLKIVNELISQGAKVTVYDPKAMENAKNVFGSNVTYTESAEAAVSHSDYVLIVTEWDEFRNKQLYVDAVVVDGRKIDEAKTAKVYEGLCW